MQENPPLYHDLLGTDAGRKRYQTKDTAKHEIQSAVEEPISIVTNIKVFDLDEGRGTPISIKVQTIASSDLENNK